MPKKSALATPIGFAFIISLSVFLRKLYILTNGGLLGIMFGSANSSVWERFKPLALSFLIWSVLELAIFSPPMKRFSVVRTASLLVLTAIFLPCALTLEYTTLPYEFTELALSSLSIVIAFIFSHFMMKSPLKFEKVFAESMFFLLLLIALYLRFTAFPPNNIIFNDSVIQ